MDFGVFSYNTNYVMQPIELAQALEERGFESLWIGEHTHIPANRKTPYPLGGELPRVYVDMMDPFVALGAAAAVTKKLKLGPQIWSPPLKFSIGNWGVRGGSCKTLSH